MAYTQLGIGQFWPLAGVLFLIYLAEKTPSNGTRPIIIWNP